MIITVPIYLDAVEIVSHPIKDFDAKWREFLSKKVKNKGWEYIIQHSRGFDYEKEMFINDEQKLKFLTDRVDFEDSYIKDKINFLYDTFMFVDVVDGKPNMLKYKIDCMIDIENIYKHLSKVDSI